MKRQNMCKICLMFNEMEEKTTTVTAQNKSEKKNNCA